MVDDFEIGLCGIYLNPRPAEITLETAGFISVFLSGRFTSLDNELVSLGVLGRGACSKVYKSLHIPSLRIVAQKIIPSCDEQKWHQVVRELRTLYYASFSIKDNHNMRDWKYDSCSVRKHIVNFYDAFIDPRRRFISVLIEYMDGGSLQDVVDTGGCPHETVLANLARRILKGLVYLHSIRNYIHRDIKPANLLINHHGDIKIGDFGTTRTCSADTQTGDRKLCDDESAMTFVGTVSYMSPERLLGQSYCYKADVWSLGMTLLTCALGHFPYATEAGRGFWSLLQALRETTPPELPHDQFSPLARDFVKQCLQRVPRSRPSAVQLLEHPFVAKSNRTDAHVRQIHTTPEAVQLELREITSLIKTHYKSHRPSDGTFRVHFLIDRSRLACLAYQLGVPNILIKHEFDNQTEFHSTPSEIHTNSKSARGAV